MEVLVLDREHQIKLQLAAFPKVTETPHAVILSWGVGEKQVEVTMDRTFIQTLISECLNCSSLKNSLDDAEQEISGLREELEDSLWDTLVLFA